MRIMDPAVTMFDEYQGLTEDVVKAWLGRNGWVRQETETEVRLGYWNNPAAHITERIYEFSLLSSISFDILAQAYGVNIQGVLRMINPRWRKGFPSNEALSEHDEWLIRVPWDGEFVAHISYGGSDDGFMIMFPPDSESGECGGLAQEVWDDCFYWPCDGNANRVRWPTDADGRML